MRTYADRLSRAAWLLPVGLLVVAMLPSGLASVAFGATTPTVSLSLGSTSSALYPVSEGVPVYTVGDTVWAMSGYNSSVPVSLTSAKASPSAPTNVVLTTSLAHGVIVPLYTFGAKDQDGVWNITLTTPQGPEVVPVHFVNPVAHPVSLSPFGYSLSGGSLVISTTANLGDSYDQEVCTVGNDTSAGWTLALPPDIGVDGGNLTLTPGNPVGLSVAGDTIAPFSYWFELYHSYALDVMNTNNLASENVMAAASQPVAFSKNGTATTTVAWNVPVHPGRYEMRTYFQNSTGLDVVQSSVLVLGDTSWVPLNGACPTQTVQSSNISYSASLTGGLSNWPETLYFMYETFGVDQVVSFPVRANLSTVDFSLLPWNATSLNVNVSPSTGVVQTSEAGSSLFVLASQYPAQVPYTLDVNGEKDVAQGTATVASSYSTVTEPISLAFLSVHVKSNSNLATTLSVAGAGLTVSGIPVEANKTATFLLPAGSYTVTGDQANQSQSAQAGLTDETADAVTLTFHVAATSSAASPYLTLELVLVLTAVVAIALNVAQRFRRSTTLGERMAKTPAKTPGTEEEDQTPSWRKRLRLLRVKSPDSENENE